MSRSNITEQFVDILYEMSETEFDENLIWQAKRCLLDYLGVAIAGSVVNRQKVENISKVFPGECSIINHSSKVSINTAVMLNAYNAHVLELDDGHRLGMLHIGAVLFPALMAVAEKTQCTMKMLYKGVIVGYETTIRLARTIQPEHKKMGFHATGTCGTVGCALGIAVMLGYSREEMMNVLSAAATSAAGLLEVIVGKSEQKPYNIANAANAGVNAALFGKYFCGPEDVLGGERGFLKNFSNQYTQDVLLEEKGNYAINGIYMKPYAACRHCHAPIEAAILLGQKTRYSEEEVDKIIVETYDLAVYGHEHKSIEGINSAKMSIPYGIAVALLHGNAGVEMYSEIMIKDNDICQLAQKVEVIADEKLSALSPNKRVAVVSIKQKNGNNDRVRVDYPKGEPENPIKDNELIEKFSSLLEYGGIEKTYSDEIRKFIVSDEDNIVSDLFKLLKEAQK